MKHVLILVPILLGVVFQANLQARETQAIKSDLDARQTAYNTQLGRVNAAKERLSGAQAALRSAGQIARSRKQQMDLALTKYRSVQQLAIERPEISPEKDRRGYAAAKAAYEEAQGREPGAKAPGNGRARGAER